MQFCWYTGPHADILMTGGALQRAVVNALWGKVIKEGLTAKLSGVMGLTVPGTYNPLPAVKMPTGFLTAL